MNTTDDRIEIGGGYYWERYKTSRDTGLVYGSLFTPDGKPLGVWYDKEIEAFAAALAPAPAMSAVELAKRIAHECNGVVDLDNPLFVDNWVSKAAALIQAHTDNLKEAK